GATARREKELSGRWWTALVGYRSASSWTLTAALVAVFVTILIAQDAQHRSSWVYVVLGLLCVATSWALMVYAFALQYLRLAAGDDADARHIEIEADGDAVFGDYLTLAVLLSTAAATISA